MDATCVPVAPPPITIIEPGGCSIAHAALSVSASSPPGTGSERGTPPTQSTNVADSNREPSATATV